MADKEVNYNINVNTDKATKNVDKLNSSIKDTGEASSNAKNQLNSISGGKLGALTGIVKTVTTSFKSLKIAIISTGIGALALAVLAVVTAFKSSEAGQDKFTKIMARIGVVIGNVMDIISDFGEVIIAAFENPQKAWTSFVDSLKVGYNFIKNQVIDRFSANWTIVSGMFEKGVLKMRIAWNDFTGDTKEADKLRSQVKEINKEILDSVDLINKRNQEVVDLYNKATGAVKDFIKANKDEIAQSDAVSDMRAKADKIERSLLIERAKLEGEISELKLKSKQIDKFSAKERRDALIEAQKLEDGLLQKETVALSLRAEAIKLENTFSKSNKENLDAEAEAIAAVIRQRTARNNARKATTEEINAINNEIKASNQKVVDDEKREAEALIKFKEGLAAKANDERIAKLDKEKSDRLIELELLKTSEEEKAQLKLDIEKSYIDQKNAIIESDKQAKKEKETEEFEEQLEKLSLQAESELLNFETKRLLLAEQRQLLLDDELLTDDQRQKALTINTAKEAKLEEQKRKQREETFNKLISLVNAESNVGRALLIAKSIIQAKELMLDVSKTIAFGKGSVARSQIAISEGVAQTAKIGFPQNVPMLIGYAAQAAGIISSIRSATKSASSISIPNIDVSSAQSTSFTPPSNLSQQSNVATINQQAQQSTIQAFVVSNDITNQQSLDRNIITQASI